MTLGAGVAAWWVVDVDVVVWWWCGIGGGGNAITRECGWVQGTLQASKTKGQQFVSPFVAN